MDNSNIFIKHKDIEREEHKLVLKDLIESIPEDRYTEQQTDLKKDHLEWRWRIFMYNDKKIVEISINTPETIDASGNVVNSARKFIDKYGKWVQRDVDELFDKYVIEQYYYYTSS